MVAGNALIALLCAGSLAPILAVAASAGDLASAVAGLVGSIGGNIATDLITGIVERVRGQDEDSDGLSPAAVERALTVGIEKALAGGGEEGVAMRLLASAILCEAEAVRAVLAGAATAGPEAAEALAVGLAQLGEQFGEFAAESGRLRDAAAALHEELLAGAAERREAAGREQHLALLTARLTEALDAGAVGQVGEARVWPQCPYPGLAPFDERDAQVFFGRREMTRRLVQTVAERGRVGGMLVMLGASGAGKSSLLRAGLIPALTRDVLGPGSRAWPARVITPTGAPLAELAALLASLAGGDAREVEQLLRVSPRRAVDLAAQGLAPHQREAREVQPVLVLAVDQFEQLFTLAPADQRAPFLAALHALAQPRGAVPEAAAGAHDGPVAVVLASIRGDYLDQAVADPGVAEAVAAGPFIVDAMTRAQLRQAIEGPAIESGVRVEKTLVATILDEAFGSTATAGPGGQVLPLVSQALAETWRVRSGRSLTLSSYLRVGGLAETTDRSAQEVWQTKATRCSTPSSPAVCLSSNVTRSRSATTCCSRLGDRSTTGSRATPSIWRSTARWSPTPKPGKPSVASSTAGYASPWSARRPPDEPGIRLATPSSRHSRTSSSRSRNGL